MTLSGEHDSDFYNFIDVAIKNVKAGNLTKLGCYYFFKRCNDNPEVDAKFSTEVEDGIKGNSDDTLNMIPSDEISVSAQKKRALAAIVNLSEVAKSIEEQMKEMTRVAKLSTSEMQHKNDVARAKNRLLEQTNLISLASQLGNKEIMQTLLGNIMNESEDEFFEPQDESKRKSQDE